MFQRRNSSSSSSSGAGKASSSPAETKSPVEVLEDATKQRPEGLSPSEYVLFIDRVTHMALASSTTRDKMSPDNYMLRRVLIALTKLEMYKLPAFLGLFHQLVCKEMYALAYANHCRMGSQLMNLFLIFHGDSYLDVTSMLISLQMQEAPDPLVLSLVRKHAAVLGSEMPPGALTVDDTISTLVLDSYIRHRKAISAYTKAETVDKTLFEFMDAFAFDLQVLGNAYADGKLYRRHMYYYSKHLALTSAREFAETANFGKDSVLMLMPTSSFSDAVEAALKSTSASARKKKTKGGEEKNKEKGEEVVGDGGETNAKLFALHAFQERRMQFVYEMLEATKKGITSVSEQTSVTALPESLKLQIAMNSLEQVLPEWKSDFQMYPLDDPFHERSREGGGGGGGDTELEGAWTNMREALFDVFGVEGHAAKSDAVATQACIFGGCSDKKKDRRSEGRYASTVLAAQSGKPFQVVLNQENRLAVRAFARKVVEVVRGVMNDAGAPTFALDIA